jgi:hypothetical protein
MRKNMLKKKIETKNYFTPFILRPLRIDMNIVHSLSTRTNPSNFPVEHYYNNNNNNNLIQYYNIVLDNKCEREDRSRVRLAVEGEKG